MMYGKQPYLQSETFDLLPALVARAVLPEILANLSNICSLYLKLSATENK